MGGIPTLHNFGIIVVSFVHEFKESEPFDSISAVVLRDDRDSVPAYHLLANSAAAEYLWDRLIDAMAEFDGRPVGWTAVRELARG